MWCLQGSPSSGGSQSGGQVWISFSTVFSWASVRHSNLCLLPFLHKNLGNAFFSFAMWFGHPESQWFLKPEYPVVTVWHLYLSCCTCFGAKQISCMLKVESETLNGELLSPGHLSVSFIRVEITCFLYNL